MCSEKYDPPRLREENIHSVTIGLPTYNGEEFVRHAIESLLAQTYTDFQLVIADDNSTDETFPICAEYLADPRVQLTRNHKNLGGQANLQSILAKTESDYFVWASQDDYWAPTFLEELIAVLERDSRLSLAFSDTVFINGAGTEYRYNFNKSWSKYCSSKYGLIIALILPVDNFGWFKSNLAIHGLIRTDILKKSFELLLGVATHDRIYILFTILLGKWGYINHALYYRRVYTGQALREQSNDPIFLAQRSIFNPAISSIKMARGVFKISGVQFRLRLFAMICILGYLISSYLARLIGLFSRSLKATLPDKIFISIRAVYRRALGK